MKELKILREAWVDEKEIVMVYKIKEDTTLSIKEIALKFPSLTQEEVESIFLEVAKKYEIDNSCLRFYEYSSFEIRRITKKDKKEIRKKHRKTIKMIKEALEECEQKEKEKGLKDWLWKKKEFKI